MISYVKIWTAIFNDEWFVSLNCNQRGVWLQLLVWSKMVGDTGVISARSRTALGHTMGCDGKTLGNFLRKFRADGKIDLKEEGNLIKVKILNYMYWQGLRSGKYLSKRKSDGKSQGIFQEYSPTIYKRTDKKIVEVEVEEKSASPTNQDQNNQNKKPVDDLDQWANSKSIKNRFEELAQQPGFEIDWIDDEFDKFRTEVLMKPDWAVESRITNYNNDWGNMFFAWLKRAKRGGERDRYYQRKK